MIGRSAEFAYIKSILKMFHADRYLAFEAESDEENLLFQRGKDVRARAYSRDWNRRPLNGFSNA